jgi:predicted nucleic acid-binding protein
MTMADTTVWIDLFAGRSTPQVAELESLIAGEAEICLCGAILTEVLQGIRDNAEYTRTESVLSNLIFLPMAYSTFLLAADIYRLLRTHGITIRNSIDCMIAAVCIENDTQLLHNDRDFDYIAKYFELQTVDVSE